MLHRLKIEPSTLSEFMLVRACVCLSRWMEHKTYSFRRLFCKPIVVYHPSSLFFTRFHSSNVYLSLLGCYPYTHIHSTHTSMLLPSTRDEAIFFLGCFYFYWPARKLCVMLWSPHILISLCSHYTHPCSVIFMLFNFDGF